MGTRSLTVVVWNNEVKVAQYEQWDGYPESLGIEILSFLSSPSHVKDLKWILSKVRFQYESNREKELTYQALKNNRNILDNLLRLQNHREIVLVNSYHFAAEGCWCEWAYVIDFDSNTFEVYTGSNKSGISEDDRFFDLYEPGSDSYPVKLLASFPLSKLPTPNAFINALL